MNVSPSCSWEQLFFHWFLRRHIAFPRLLSAYRSVRRLESHERSSNLPVPSPVFIGCELVRVRSSPFMIKANICYLVLGRSKTAKRTHKHLAHIICDINIFSGSLVTDPPSRVPRRNCYHVPWVPNTAHKHLTPGHPVGRPSSPRQSPDEIVYVYVPSSYI